MFSDYDSYDWDPTNLMIESSDFFSKPLNSMQLNG